MRLNFASNGDFISLTLVPDTGTEEHLLEAFRSSTLPVFCVEKVAGGLKVTRRETPVPNEETGNTR